ncbi:type II toxin-antitoxin system HicA family toxin [Enterococcus lemanii]|jgi:predicted RNA binding protein YcfA (HicA-like mRNA interferase family)|uniref:Type II toxin-antitoxin system HicA family toxin n=1 Tax=Enterococcus lemanii TaxID=1159752 RepID=A0ABV9MWS8_9ENTE|nr:type II toxin-antitoxin system HicA family toxin [Enterococcus lemanii]MBM7708337.1 putative RNA binding protein YcfA (HicA-like mRNA interferase family) [Enterococcus lemanii]NLM65851.1 type II toxin-antitoxin system HicA family toxin [Enterococcus sp.]
MNAKQVIKILNQDGWYLDSQRGSHKYYKHPSKKGKVTVADHGKKEIPLKTLNSIWKTASLK